MLVLLVFHWQDRAELIRIAAQRLEARRPGVEIVQQYHIGDAPSDVAAAQLAGAKPIGVTTGIFTAEELRQAAPSCTVLGGFARLEGTLQCLGMSSPRAF